jgi:hypothetical protein
MPNTLPNLNNFWMDGHCVYLVEGLPTRVSTARKVILEQ